MNPALMIFIDGIGIGKKDYEVNPFFKYGFKAFSEIFGAIPDLDNQYLNKNGYYLFPSDATLGVSGFPQSGTGQTSIFCGINAAKFIGKHFGPYPYSSLIPVIKAQNIFLHYSQQGKRAYFANAYPKVFFDYIASGKSRLSTTSLSCISAGLRLNDFNDVMEARALTAEITNERWNRQLGYELPIITPQEAARTLLKISGQNTLTVYEYFMTDHFGHGRYRDEMVPGIKTLDDFLYTILSEMDMEQLTFLICSDHGNFEDISIKTHTLNPSVTISAGKYAKELSEEIRDLTQIKAAITKYIK